MEEVLERQLLIRDHAFATFSTIERAVAGRKKSFRGTYVVPSLLKASNFFKDVKIITLRRGC